MTYLIKYVSKRIRRFDLNIFSIITGRNEFKILMKHLWCEYKCEFDRRKCNSDQKWDNDKCWWNWKKHDIFEKGSNWISATCGRENGKYLAVITDDLVMVCDKNIEETKTIPTTFNQKIVIAETKNLYILLAFLLITLALLRAARMYFSLVKTKQKHLFSYDIRNNKSKKVL